MRKLICVLLVALPMFADLKKRPPTKVGPSKGKSVTVKPCADAKNKCFGAMGANCTGLLPNEWPALFQLEGLANIGCHKGECFISTGSWDHDECCFSTPSGHMCDGIPTLAASACFAEWVKAGHRASHRLVWKRRVPCQVDGDGVVNFNSYCAPGGTIVAAEDESRCCSGNARAFAPVSDAIRAARQGVVLDNSFVPVVCTGSEGSVPVSSPPPQNTTPPPPPPKPCMTNAQCRQDERCLAISGETQKRCWPAI